MKIAITGAAGLFGHDLVEAARGAHDVIALTRAEADITAPDQVRAVIQKARPDVVIHAAAVPDLDICEADPAKAYLVNVHGTRHVVEACGEVGAAVAYISTDAVFDGKKSTPYVETDATIPPTVYGRTKLRAEQIVSSLTRHWVFRVSVLFGPGKANTIDKTLRGIAAGEKVAVAEDQIGCATYTLDAGRKILEVIDSGRVGLYHLANQGQCSRFELAARAATLAGLDTSLLVGKSVDEMGRRAVRLKYAVMRMAALESVGFSLPRPWQEALAEYVASAVPALGLKARRQVHS
jgi:dTDP-4-dehydrorhamnose reductase